MKILRGALEPSAGNVSKGKSRAHGLPEAGPVPPTRTLRVLDVVLMGHENVGLMRASATPSTPIRKRPKTMKARRPNTSSANTTVTRLNPVPASCRSASASRPNSTTAR